MADLDSFYTNIFGERWLSGLKPALLSETTKVFLVSPFDGGEFSISHEPQSGSYALDLASTEPVYALDLRDGDEFLDLCSAPGGKALTALYLTGGLVRAHLNDSSTSRVGRLRKVLREYLPASVVSSVRVTCRDGGRFGQTAAGSFDAVLADVPCSTERHHMLAGSAADDWTEGKTKRMAIRQHSLLCSAFDSLKPGGRVVYSTCSMSPYENDGVIQKLLKSRAGLFSVVTSTRTLGEPTEFGRMILPDVCDGWGPIYYSILRKNLE